MNFFPLNEPMANVFVIIIKKDEIFREGIVISERGIMRHGKFKTFLTRGKFKSVFKPLIYKKEDHVHSDFLNALLPIANGINFDDNLGRFIVYWLVQVPRQLFEEIFIENESGEYYLDAVKDSDLNNGELCAYYTQAFTLWHLEQFLKNNVEYRNSVGIEIDYMEYMLKEFYGAKNLTIQYLNEIRNEFNIKSMKVDPRDWGIIYVHYIYDLLINGEQKKVESIKAWDNDVLEKMNLVEFIIKFFVFKKDESILVMQS